MSSGTKLLLIGWDSADWEMAGPMMEAGQLPALRRLVESGASGKLRTLEPMLSPVLWTSIATGQTADRHGVLGFTEVDRLTGKVRPVVGASRKVPAVWDMLAAEGFRCQVIGWFATQGEEIPGGGVVSNFFPAPAAPPGEPWPPSPPGAVWPTDHATALDALRVSPADVDGEVIGLFCPRWREVDTADDHRLNHLQIHLADAFTIQAAACWTLRNTAWDFVAVYFRAMDEIGHHFMPFHPPRMDGVPPRDFELYREVMCATYRLHDLMLARLMALAPPETHIVLVSDHGFHSGQHRPKFTPRVPAGITVWHREHGIFAAAGPRFQPDTLVHGAGLLDVCPTILEVYGLPAGHDMPGRAPGSALRPQEGPPLARIPTWEARCPPRRHTGTLLSDAENLALVEQFVALGYLDKPTGDLGRDAELTDRENRWTLARSLRASGRPAGALPVLAALYREMPERTDFAQMFARCQMDCGLLEEAVATVEAILETAGNAPVAELLRAQLALASGDAGAALVHLEAARATPVGQEPRFWRQLGLCLLTLRRWDEALEAAERLAVLVPDDALAPLGRSLCLRRLGRVEEARQAALEAIGLHFAMPRAHMALARACLRLGQHERALKAARQAVELAPSSAEALRLLAAALRVCGEPAAARSVQAHRRFLAASARHNLAELRREMQDALGRRRGVTSAPLATPKSPASQEPIVIVTGLPRSGTSLMMQCLAAGGCRVLTDGKRSADAQNPEGYFEWEPARLLPQEPALIDQAAGQAVKVVTPLLPHLPTGRNCRFILLRRNFTEVARSQAAMRARFEGDGMDPDVMAVLLEKHWRAARGLLENQGAAFLEVDFRDLLSAPAACAHRLAAFLGPDLLPHPQNIPARIRPELHHQRAEQVSEQSH